MKKIILILVVVISITIIVGCTSDSIENEEVGDNTVITPTPTPIPKVEELVGAQDDILKKLYQAVGIDSSNMVFTKLNDDNTEYYLGTADIVYDNAMAVEPMINVNPHSVVLVKVNEDNNIEETKAKIKDNANGYKWICVGVEDENILVENIGHTIILIMDENAKAFKDAFFELETK